MLASSAHALTMVQAEKDTGPVREDEQIGSWFSNPSAGLKAADSATKVGIYLKLPAQNMDVPAPAAEGPPAKKLKQTSYGNFDAW